MVSLPSALGQLPRFYELGPLRFQGLCRDLYQVEPVSLPLMYSVRQAKHNVGLMSLLCTGTTGQCKCVRPERLTPSLLRAASKEFLGESNFPRLLDTRVEASA